MNVIDMTAYLLSETLLPLLCFTLFIVLGGYWLGGRLKR